ncbi:MAG: hypothetical protein FWB97_01200 [Oscillospiraceae bacterium]|nr:hypothetical protein [Oscillospiraceae bacterium]
MTVGRVTNELSLNDFSMVNRNASTTINPTPTNFEPIQTRTQPPESIVAQPPSGSVDSFAPISDLIIAEVIYSSDGDRAEISVRAMDLLRNFMSEAASGTSNEYSPAREVSAELLEALEPSGMCETCSTRRYVDDSDDASVSFQTPTTINASQSGVTVAAHEGEHVNNERENARREDRVVVHQSVTMTAACCPECGRMYFSGGVTRTKTVGRADPLEGVHAQHAPYAVEQAQEE